MAMIAKIATMTLPSSLFAGSEAPKSSVVIQEAGPLVSSAAAPAAASTLAQARNPGGRIATRLVSGFGIASAPGEARLPKARAGPVAQFASPAGHQGCRICT